MARTTDLGTIGRLHVYSDINHDREAPSTQVWVEYDNGKAYRLSASEMMRLETIMDQHEGIAV